MAIIDLTSKNFEQVALKSEVPVLIDFWADWCKPCKMMHPVFEQLSAEYGEKVKFVRVDIDEENQLAMQYGIRSIPTLLAMREGMVVGQFIGFGDKDAVMAKLDVVLSIR
ncbi:MAG: thioredoxin [Candidatus Undinarchaeales archaeon]|jgi:thioredoxin 1|nr:thioredoxin [Candidatus Undinarchaeales archaeon]MDP7494084.1 thioredoxin [Candidatus Undinarchaeales archaeon]